jgi:hypothetical protein
MPDYGFGRCDGHHEIVDFGLTIAALRTQRMARQALEDIACQSNAVEAIGAIFFSIRLRIQNNSRSGPNDLPHIQTRALRRFNPGIPNHYVSALDQPLVGNCQPAEGNDLPASTLECILASASSPRLVCWPRFMRGLFSPRVSAEDVARMVAKAGLKAVSATHEPNLNAQRRAGGRLRTLLPFPEPSWSPAVHAAKPPGTTSARKLPRLARRLARHWPALNEKHIRSDQPTNDKRRHCVSSPACRLARPAGTLSVADCAGGSARPRPLSFHGRSKAFAACR